MKGLKKKAALLIAAGVLSASILTGYVETNDGNWESQGDKWIYTFPDGSRLMDEWKKIGNFTYHFDENGYMDTGWKDIFPGRYYFGSNGHMRTKWELIDDYWYYFGEDGLMHTGWFENKTSEYYHFDSNGRMQTKWAKISGQWYYFGSDGIMHSGWLELRDEQYNPSYYYFDSNGIMQTKWQKINGRWYYFEVNGLMCTNWKQINGNWYYFGSNGSMQTGWKKISGQWFYFNESGIMQTGWQQIKGKWYYFESTGRMKTGWQKISGRWYYLDPESGKMTTGWLKSGQYWYYFQSNGAMVAGTTITISGKEYSFDENGRWLEKLTWKIENETLYFNGHRYKAYHMGTGYTWESAVDYCKSQGGHLATITSQFEQDAIYDYLKKTLPDVDVWIGLTDKDSEGNWSKWVTGEKVTYTNWAPGQPGDLGPYNSQNYAVFCNGVRSGDNWYIAQGQWDDINNNDVTNTGYLLCEWDK